MEDGDFGNLFPREDADEIQSSNELQYAIRQNANLATHICIVGFILQEVAVDIIGDSCEASLDALLEIKLLYQRGRIRKHRLEHTNFLTMLGEAGHAPQEVIFLLQRPVLDTKYKLPLNSTARSFCLFA